MNKIYVHTLGDSTLDNLYWLLNREGSNIEEAKEYSVEGQLQAKLGDHYRVVSHSYDGFTTESVLLTGGIVGGVLPVVGNKFQGYLNEKSDQPDNWEAAVFPLEKLSDEISTSPDAIHYVVISLGGNDFRANLINPLRLLGDVSTIQKRYFDILDKVQKLGSNVRPILMFQYRTDARKDPYRVYTMMGIAGGFLTAVNLLFIGMFDVVTFLMAMDSISISLGVVLILFSGIVAIVSSFFGSFRVAKGILKRQNCGMTMLGVLMEMFYRPILKRAQADNLPVLDLPNSFNPYEALYISGIEPNREGGKLIAEGLCHIIRECESKSSSDTPSSRIYCCDGQVSNNSTDRWEVKYPRMQAK
jgi:hypothetical protein